MTLPLATLTALLLAAIHSGHPQSPPPPIIAALGYRPPAPGAELPRALTH